ncbi:glutamate--tRNA ligase [Polluticoccus soli]|uniref:glutamate--tRNA ligase n=1 Tax=Polluticoccus soli TaxID=3034150 RepID=UPI0023E2ADA7|nr:glutamate--tRNA ligase [Flavipsychrobacter sp. JY13-12]
MSNKVRVRFAPSPTGGLHLGGVRTVLYNYLFARHHGGDFVLRIEDTDQNRYVEGAEEYIYKCLEWCGLEPDESPLKGGPHAPYRQSERKHLYYQYAQQLIDSGHAYYAFDTPGDLERMRQEFKTDSHTNPQYDHMTRMQMKNSLSLAPEEVIELLNNGTPYVIRIKMPLGEKVKFTDMIRGEMEFDTSLVDDKVLLKADGMPTYHLAVVVDDYLMKITHAFRGEEWLPSAPVHLLLWKYLGWEASMPQWAHLPLILKPDGHGKLSKRDGERLGFPVFAMNWMDPRTGDKTEGFREKGFLPEAFVNLLAMLGWNAGTEQEIFSLQELVEKFSIDRVHKGGAKFDYEKAKWYNHQYIQRLSDEQLATLAEPYVEAHGGSDNREMLVKVAGLIKERLTLVGDFWEQGHFFFQTPEMDASQIKDKWNDTKKAFFEAWATEISGMSTWEHTALEQSFNAQMEKHGLKKGDVLLPLRIMLVGGKYGPGVFMIAEVIGKEETVKRIHNAIAAL